MSAPVNGNASWVQAKAALMSQLHTVPGLEPAANVLGYWPLVINTPLIVVQISNWKRVQTGQVTYMFYQVLARLWLEWTDVEQAELVLDSFVNVVPATIDANPSLHGVVVRAKATDGPTNYVETAQVLYRTMDTQIEIETKGPWQSGI